MFAAVEVLSQTNIRLARLRDLVLPKLVTGAIDVSKLDLDALLDEPAA
jgi:type I restriction enzyme, S subunit